MAQTWPIEGIHPCLASPSRPVANRDEFARSWHDRSGCVTVVSCPTFRELWSHVRAWVGICGAGPLHVSDHFLQFTYLAGGAKSRHSFMQLLWLLCVWVLWTVRKNRQFNNTEFLSIRWLTKLRCILTNG